MTETEMTAVFALIGVFSLIQGARFAIAKNEKARDRAIKLAATLPPLAWIVSILISLPTSWGPLPSLGALIGRLLFGAFLFVWAGYITAFAAFGFAWAATYLGKEFFSVCRNRQ